MRHYRRTVKGDSVKKKKKTPVVSEGAPSMFCTRARERRAELGISGTDLGEIIGWTHQQVYRMEGGMFPRDEQKIAAIADALGVTLDWLFGRE